MFLTLLRVAHRSLYPRPELLSLPASDSQEYERKVNSLVPLARVRVSTQLQEGWGRRHVGLASPLVPRRHLSPLPSPRLILPLISQRFACSCPFYLAPPHPTSGLSPSHKRVPFTLVSVLKCGTSSRGSLRFARQTRGQSR